MATSKRGFASMDATKQREIASKGGRAAHAKGTAHEFTSDEARVAGRKGGEAVSRDRTHMAQIGRSGGHSRGARARAAAGGNAIGSNLTNSSDIAQGSGSQPFVRSANEERSAYDVSTSNRGSATGGGFGSQDRRPGNERNERNERSDNESSRDFAGRERI
jgi:general stress protein YciG